MSINDTLRVTLFQEKDPVNHDGEDGEPICVRGKDNVALAVFDGLGGHPHGEFASDWVSSFTKNFLNRNIDKLLTKEKMLGFEQDANHSLLNEASHQKKITPSLNKTQCATTIALLKLVEQEDGMCRAQLSWAGDSRVYFLSPVKGLQLLTLDDTWKQPKSPKSPAFIRPAKDTCALSNLNTNDLTGHCLAALHEKKKAWDNNKYEINFKEELIPEPGCFIVCTDGAYSNKPFPRYEEKRYLQFIQQANSASDFQERVTQYFQSTSDFADDAISIIIQPVGFIDFDQMKSRFKPRWEMILSYEPPPSLVEGLSNLAAYRQIHQHEQKIWYEHLWDNYSERLFTDSVIAPATENLTVEISSPLESSPPEISRVPAASPTSTETVPSNLWSASSSTGGSASTSRAVSPTSGSTSPVPASFSSALSSLPSKSWWQNDRFWKIAGVAAAGAGVAIVGYLVAQHSGVLQDIPPAHPPPSLAPDDIAGVPDTCYGFVVRLVMI